MIPTRIRANTNWVISFRQNPKEMKKLSEEQQDFPDAMWDSALAKVFGDESSATINTQSDKMTHDFINIQIDKRRVFKNL